MAKKWIRSINKAAAIRDTSRSTGLVGKKLAVVLQKQYPTDFGKQELERLSDYCSTVLSQARRSTKMRRLARPAADGAPAMTEVTSLLPFLAQLKSLSRIIGRQAVQEMVDKL